MKEFYSEDKFHTEFEEALSSSDNPSIEEVQEITIQILDNPNSTPKNPAYYPIFSYIRARLKLNDIPLNWITGDVLKKIKEDQNFKNEKNTRYEDFDRILHSDQVNIQNNLDFQIENAILNIILRKSFNDAIEKLKHSPDGTYINSKDISAIYYKITDYKNGKFRIEVILQSSINDKRIYSKPIAVKVDEHFY